MSTTRAIAALAFALAIVTVARPAAAQDELSRAKDLYVSAAYDEALALLDKIDPPPAAQAVEVNQYRAFCLLALGRSDDATQVIESIVEAQPAFQPADAQMSPRLQQAFEDVRRRVFPSVVRKSYAQAKEAFDGGDLKSAAERFGSLVALLHDSGSPDAGELADVESLSKGFLDLIAKMSTVAAADAAETAAKAPAPPPAPATYGAEDPNVTPAVPLAQVLPAWRPPAQDRHTYEASLALLIDPKGAVTSITIDGDLPPFYERQLRRAAQGWKFQPATKDGNPVSYRRVVEIRLGPPR